MSAATLGPTISPAGISAPSYQDILVTLQNSYKTIFGSDAYLDPDSQDGQLLAIFAQAVSDLNSDIISTYNNFSPASAQNAALSSIVKINGIARNVPSNSTAPCTVVGQAGTVITNGQAIDTAGNLWLLPSTVTIPDTGSIDVTVTAQSAGAVIAALGAINGINTPTYGWQSITNTAAATPGAPVETDGTLRGRQSASVALPSKTVIDGIYAAVANVAGVVSVNPYENDTATTDGNGVPAHSIAFVVEGGNSTDIANAIMLKKGPGVQTYGTTSMTVNDPNGYPVTINYFVLTFVSIYVDITIQPGTGYVAPTGAIIQNAVAQFINSLGSGSKVQFFKLLGAANLSGTAAITASALTNNGVPLTQAQLDTLSDSFEITSMTIGTTSPPTGTTDISIPFNEAAQITVADISLTVL